MLHLFTPASFCRHNTTPSLHLSSTQGEPLQHTQEPEHGREAVAREPAAREASAEPEMATAPSAHSTTGVQVGEVWQAGL